MGIMEMAGHVARMQENRWSTKLSHLTPRYRKRNIDRPATRWRDEIDYFNGHPTWKGEAQGRETNKL